MVELTKPQAILLKKIVINKGIRWHSLSGNYIYVNGAGGTIRKPMVNILVKKRLLSVTKRWGGSSDYILSETQSAKVYLYLTDALVD